MTEFLKKESKHLSIEEIFKNLNINKTENITLLNRCQHKTMHTAMNEDKVLIMIQFNFIKYC